MRNSYTKMAFAIKYAIATIIILLLFCTTSAQEKQICIKLETQATISFFDGIEQIIDDIPYTIGYASASKILKEVTINKTICKKSVVELLEQVLEGENLSIIEEGDFITIEETPQKKQIKTGTISGFAYEEKDGKFSPIIGAEVYLYKGKGSQIFIEATKTTNTGQYTFKNLKPGEYLIKLQSNEDYTIANDIYISLEEGKNAKDNNIVIKQFQISPVSLDCVDKINDQATELSWSTDKTDCATFISYNVYASSNRISDYNQIAQINNESYTFYIDSISDNSTPNFYYILRNCNGKLSSHSDTLDNEIPSIDYLNITGNNVEIKIKESTSIDKDTFIIQYLDNSSFVSLDTIESSNLLYLHKNDDAKPKQYSIATSNNCPVNSQPTNIVSETIFLQTVYNECEDEFYLSWTPYVGWLLLLEGYEIYTSYDGSQYELLKTVGTDTYQYNFSYESIDTSEFCFQIKAKRRKDSVTSSSNETCINIATFDNDSQQVDVTQNNSIQHLVDSFSDEIIYIRLNTFNLPRGTIIVSSGKRVLTEGVDYKINYLLGIIEMEKELYLNSNNPISIIYISPYLYVDKKTPQSIKFALVSNDFEKSSVSYEANISQSLKRSQTKKVNDLKKVCIDNFDGSTTYNDVSLPFTEWALASTPLGATNKNGQLLFPEAELTNNLSYGYSRAKINWYYLEHTAFCGGRFVLDGYRDQCDKNENRRVSINEVFPNRQIPRGQTPLIRTFDISYYPNERGPYNYTTDLEVDGTLKNPKARWGGIMRSLNRNSSTDFEASNTEFIEFWMMDPFIDNPDNSGSLYLNLGEISEDILKDSNNFGEHNLSLNSPTDESKWGVASLNQNTLSYALSTNKTERLQQDLGFDGLSDVLEREYFASYLSEIKKLPLSAQIKETILNDPSNDNYAHFRDEEIQGDRSRILNTYKKINNPEGNSPLNDNKDVFITTYPYSDKEDLNNDDVLNRSEAYFEYRIDLKAGLMPGDIPYLFDVNKQDKTRWLKFKIPIKEYTNKIGSISDFKSIRFIRLFLTGFDEPITCRFEGIDLVKNQWRRYAGSLKEQGETFNTSKENVLFNVTSVGIEEDGGRKPIPYVLPPNLVRDEILSSFGTSIAQNEKSLALQVCDLEDGDARAIFKTLDFDFREFERIKIQLHAHEGLNSKSPIKDGDVTTFIRIGSDLTQNYYEYEVPLKLTNKEDIEVMGKEDISDLEKRDIYRKRAQAIWPNEINLSIDSLIKVKENRNIANWERFCKYTELKSERLTANAKIIHGNISVIGSPDISNITHIMLGVRNQAKDNKFNLFKKGDDRKSKCVEVWFNDFALADFKQSEQFETMFTINDDIRSKQRVSIIQSAKGK